MINLSFSKFGSKSNTVDVLPAWRADFRRMDALPDVKVVRTDFLVNYGFIGLALISVAVVGVKEYNYMVLRNEIKDFTAKIEGKVDVNVRGLRDSGTFSAHMKVVDSFSQFKSTPVECIRFLSEVGSIKVGDMAIRNIVIDTLAVDPKTKKDRVKIVVMGVSKGVDRLNFEQVEAAFAKFKNLGVWSGLKKHKIETAGPVVVANTKDRVIEFTFEIFLVGVSK